MQRLKSGLGKRVLVTGGAGFIGSHLVQTLVERGDTVSILDDLSTGSHDNLLPLWDRITFIEGDVRDPLQVARACEGVDTVFHLAALGSVPRSIADPLLTNAVNVDGTLSVLSAARKHGVRRVVFSSSSSVYGNTPSLPKHERMPTSPRSPYAVSKLAGEEYCRVFHEVYGLETVVLRYFNVFGPRQQPDSPYSAVIPRFVSAMLRGEQPVLYGDGQQSRDFTYVANVVRANLLAAEAAGVAGEVFNIACGEQVSLARLLDEVAQITGHTCRPAYQPARAGDVQHSLADISAARRRLHYEPRVSFHQGLRQTVESYACRLSRNLHACQ